MTSTATDAAQGLTPSGAAASAAPAMTRAQRLAAEKAVRGQDKRTGEPVIARMWKRKIRTEWDTDDPGTNLLAELADMRSRPQLLNEGDLRFLAHIERVAIKPSFDGSRLVILSNSQLGRLAWMVRRYTSPAEAAKFHLRQREWASLDDDIRRLRERSATEASGDTTSTADRRIYLDDLPAYFRRHLRS